MLHFFSPVEGSLDPPSLCLAVFLFLNGIGDRVLFVILSHVFLVSCTFFLSESTPNTSLPCFFCEQNHHWHKYCYQLLHYVYFMCFSVPHDPALCLQTLLNCQLKQESFFITVDTVGTLHAVRGLF